jgi:hypothetical protein
VAGARARSEPSAPRSAGGGSVAAAHIPVCRVTFPPQLPRRGQSLRQRPGASESQPCHAAEAYVAVAAGEQQRERMAVEQQRIVVEEQRIVGEPDTCGWRAAVDTEEGRRAGCRGGQQRMGREECSCPRQEHWGLGLHGGCMEAELHEGCREGAVLRPAVDSGARCSVPERRGGGGGGLEEER